MGSLRNMIKMIALAIVVGLLLYFGARAFAVLAKGYSWVEMDWNKDGKTSLQEFFESSDIDRRPIQQGNMACIEYYQLKDGLPVKVSCAQNK